MDTFFKGFLREDVKRTRAVTLAVFGKHPGWKDHVDPIGLDTPSLLTAARSLYEQGLGGKGGPITSGAWDRLSVGEQLAGFGHVFVWRRSDRFLLGRIWASSDSAQPPRTRYPLIACLQVAGVPLVWALRHLLPGLEEVPGFCRIRNAGEIEATVTQVWRSETYRDELRQQVKTGLERLRQQLGALVARTPAAGFESQLTPPERQRFLAAPELGADHEGLLRVLHQAHNRFGAYMDQRSLTKADPAELRPAQIRVPVADPSAGEGILLWSALLSQVLAADAPILFMAPLDATWIDVTVGEPSPDQFFCLRAGLGEIPLATSIPFEVDAAVREQGSRIIAAYRAGDPPPAPRPPETGFVRTAASFFRNLRAKAGGKWRRAE